MLTVYKFRLYPTKMQANMRTVYVRKHYAWNTGGKLTKLIVFGEKWVTGSRLMRRSFTSPFLLFLAHGSSSLIELSA